MTTLDPENPELLRELLVSHSNVGAILRTHGDLSGALAEHRAGMEIATRLVASDSRNSQWQTDLAIAHQRVGDVLLAMARKALEDALVGIEPQMSGDKFKLEIDRATALREYHSAKAIIERLAKSDPFNKAWQRTLAVSHNKIGDALMELQDLDGALEAYRVGKAITESLATSDPKNSEWQRDLAFCHDRIGEVLLMQGNPYGAYQEHLACRKITSQLANSDPENGVWQRDQLVAELKLLRISATREDTSGMHEFALALVERARNLAQRFPGMPQFKHDIQSAQALLHEIDGGEN